MKERKYGTWEDMSAEQKQEIQNGNQPVTCLGKYKTGNRFIFSAVTCEMPDFLITQTAAMALFEKHGILPKPLLFWPEHGLRYTDFRIIFRDALSGKDITEHPERGISYFDSTPHSMGIRGQYDTGKRTRLYLSAKLDYLPIGPDLTVAASISGLPGENDAAELLLNASVTLPDDRSVKKTLSFLLDAISQDRIARAVQAYHEKNA